MIYSILTNGCAIASVSTTIVDEWVQVEHSGSAADLATNYSFVDGDIKFIGERPSPYHCVCSDSGEWVFNLELAIADKKESINASLAKQIYQPCNGFDADKVSRERISGMIARLQRGDGLPPMWAGWRDADNEMHWINDSPETVLEGLKELSRAIEDREQALLVTAWSHKAAIEELKTLEQILNYSVEF